jgi:hypothetical protein
MKEDFIQLGEIYNTILTESALSKSDKDNKDNKDADKDKDEDKKNKNTKASTKRVSEEKELGADEAESDDDVEKIEEGMFDRIGAKASGLKSASGQYLSNIGKAVKGDLGDKTTPEAYEDAKRSRIVTTHSNKLRKQLSDFATDLVKLEIMGSSDAEKLAKSAYNSIVNIPLIKKYIQIQPTQTNKTPIKRTR